MRPALEIIHDAARPEEPHIPASFAKFIAESDVASGASQVFQYGNVVFTVSREGMVHVFSDGDGPKMFRAASHFMKDVWKRTGLSYLFAPTKNPGVVTLAERFGWDVVGEVKGFTIVAIKKDKQ